MNERYSFFENSYRKVRIDQTNPSKSQTRVDFEALVDYLGVPTDPRYSGRTIGNNEFDSMASEKGWEILNHLLPATMTDQWTAGTSLTAAYVVRIKKSLYTALHVRQKLLIIKGDELFERVRHEGTVPPEEARLQC